jgi:hypothetical protein
MVAPLDADTSTIKKNDDVVNLKQKHEDYNMRKLYKQLLQQTEHLGGALRYNRRLLTDHAVS